MRSVYAKVLLWCFGTLAFSLVAFAVISAAAQVRAFGHGGPFEKTSTWLMQGAPCAGTMPSKPDDGGVFGGGGPPVLAQSIWLER